jgi:hypothetical protein
MSDLLWKVPASLQTLSGDARVREVGSPGNAASAPGRSDVRHQSRRVSQGLKCPNYGKANSSTSRQDRVQQDLLP